MEQNIDRIMVPLGVTIAIILIIIGGYFVFSPEKTNKFDYDQISELEKELPRELSIETHEEKLQKNTDVPFNIGESFKYRKTSTSDYGQSAHEEIYSVKNIEKVNGNDCYVINLSNINNITINWIFYIDKKTGDIVKGVSDSYEIKTIVSEEEIKMYYTEFFFAPWMLALSDDFEWTQTFSSGGRLITKIEYKVIGREKMNDRECFKVEIKGDYYEKYSRAWTKTVWIDANKRILVKSQMKLYDLSIETNLIAQR